MSGKISSKTKHTVSDVLSKHDLPVTNYRGDALASSLTEHAVHTDAVYPTQRCEEKLPLAAFVLKLLQEEKPFTNYR